MRQFKQEAAAEGYPSGGSAELGSGGSRPGHLVVPANHVLGKTLGNLGEEGGVFPAFAAPLLFKLIVVQQFLILKCNFDLR